MKLRRGANRKLAAACLLMAGLTLFPGTQKAAAADARGVGRLVRVPPEVTREYGIKPQNPDDGFVEIQGLAVLVPSERVLVQVYQDEDEGVRRIVLYVRDLDTLATRFKAETQASFNEADRAIFPAFDPVRKRLFIADVDTDPGTLFSPVLGFLTLDLANKALAETPYPPSIRKPYKTGLTYDARKDRLYTVSASTCGGVTGCPGALNLLSALKPSGEVEYQRPLRACRGTMPDEFADTSDPSVRILSVQDGSLFRLHIPCWLRQEVSGVLVVNADDPNDTSEIFVAGPPQMAQFFADPASGRMVFVGRPGTGVQEEGFVYDAGAKAFIGAMGITIGGARSGYGLDSDTGVFFGINNITGLLSSQIRLDPIPQPEGYRGFAAGFGSARVWYDSGTSRLFVLKDGKTPSDTYERSAAYEIVSVPRPIPVPPAQDPDRYTTDTPENAATRASFAANGSGYGLRILVARGLQGAVPTPGDSLNLPAYAQNEFVPNKCGFADRAIALGTVGTSQAPVSLTDTGAGARAAEIEVDDGTKVDLESPSRCDQLILPRVFVSELLDIETGIFSNATLQSLEVPQLIDKSLGKPWGYRPAECSGSDIPRTSGRSEGATDVGSATVTCDASSDSIHATSNGRIDLEGISVSNVLTTLRIVRKVGEGATVVTTSTARGIQIGDIAIGEIRSVATSHSGGRPGTATASFTREIKGLILPGEFAPISCKNAGCNDYLARLNQAFAGRAEFRFPVPDESICRSGDAQGACKGTPGGAQAGILKSEFRRASDKAMSGDASREIPGLELLVYNDNQHLGRARQLLQLAGVQASTSYNISALQEGSGFPSGGFTSVFEEVPFGEIAAGDLGDVGEPKVGLFKRFIRKVLKPIAEGLILLFASPRDAVRSATAWVLLAAPVIMAVRRRRLLDLHRSS